MSKLSGWCANISCVTSELESMLVGAGATKSDAEAASSLVEQYFTGCKTKESRRSMATISLPVDMDLSHCAYEEAVRAIKNHVINTEEKPCIELFTLYCGFWDSDEAMSIMAKYKNCDVVVRRDMAPYRWSLECVFHDVILVSKGA